MGPSPVKKGEARRERFPDTENVVVDEFEDGVQVRDVLIDSTKRLFRFLTAWLSCLGRVSHFLVVLRENLLAIDGVLSEFM